MLCSKPHLTIFYWLLLICCISTACAPVAVYKYKHGNVRATLRLYPTDRYAYKEYYGDRKVIAKGDYEINDSTIRLDYPHNTPLPFLPETSVLDLQPQQYRNVDHTILVVDYTSREPLLFATIALYDDTGKVVRGTETDQTGYATVYMPDEAGSIEVSYVGYMILRLQVSDIVGHDITIALQPSYPESSGCLVFAPPQNILSAKYTDDGIDLEGHSFRNKKGTIRK